MKNLHQTHYEVTRPIFSGSLWNPPVHLTETTNVQREESKKLPCSFAAHSSHDLLQIEKLMYHQYDCFQVLKFKLIPIETKAK